MELAAGRVEGTLIGFRPVVYKRTTVLGDHITEKPFGRHFSQSRIFVQVADDLSTQQPEVVHVPANGPRSKTRCRQVLDEWPEASQQLLAGPQVSFSDPIHECGQPFRSRP